MGACSTPSRIFKGKIGAGHLGVEQVTVQNLDVVKVDPDLNMIVVRGAIPGPKGGLVYIHSTVKTIRVKNTDEMCIRDRGGADRLYFCQGYVYLPPLWLRHLGKYPA